MKINTKRVEDEEVKSDDEYDLILMKKAFNVNGNKNVLKL